MMPPTIPSQFKFLVCLFLGLLAFYWIGVERENRERLLTGDEPHYMLIMESINRYGSVELSRISRDRDFDEGVRSVIPHRSGSSVPGSIYSVHHIGLPLLLAPLHRAEGYSAVTLFFVVCTVLFVCNLFLYIDDLTGRRWIAFLLSLLAACSAPVVFYFRFVYPDMVAALFVLYAYRQFTRADVGWGRFVLAVILTAYLPWLHIKYLIFSVTLAAFVLVRRSPDWRRVACISVLLVLSGVPMMWYFLTAFDSWLPGAQYDEHNATVSWLFWRGLLGTFFDRNHGLVAWSPYLLIACLGIVPCWRAHRTEVIRILILVVPSTVIMTSHWMWWGGPCPPGRFFLPFWAFLFPFVACGLTMCRQAFLIPVAGGSVFYALLSGLFSWLAPGSLPQHLHNAFAHSPFFHAYPSLPTLAVHYRYAYPNITLATMPVLFGLMAVLIFLGRRGVKEVRKPVAAFLAGVILCIGVPACLSWAHASIDTKHWLLLTNNRKLARAAWNVRMGLSSEETVTFEKSAQGTANPGHVSEERPRWFMTYDFLTLYAQPMDVTFHVTTEGPEGEVIGLVDASAFCGEKILAKAPIVASPDPTTITISLHPEKRMDQVEFRACLTAPGAARVSAVTVSLHQ